MHPRVSNTLSLLATVLALVQAHAVGAAAATTLTLPARSRIPAAADTNQWQAVEKTVSWDPNKTAIVICDMWDKHWCAGATRRVSEMAPRMNDVLKKARAQGVFIIHCPSGTMKAYADTPGRKLAQAAPAATPKVPLQSWCALDRTREAPLPIDDSDGGCDDHPQCKGGGPWQKQIATLEIQPGDAITDNAEAYYLMQQRGIDNVIVMGVHLNMCVLGRPFSIRQMVMQGKNVLLMRDLTDTMYNSRRSPFVPHCAGTSLMLEHVEKFWCPTISSVAFLGGSEFRFSEDRRPNIVFLIGEDEYKTWETLPAFASRDLAWRGLQVSIFLEDKQNPGNFPGLINALGNADLLLVSTRRRALRKDQLDAVRAYLNAGKPLVGLRTASHAFAPGTPKNSPAPADVASWTAFDAEVLGGNYHGHHGNSIKTDVRSAPGAENHPILAGVNLQQLTGHGSLYKAGPLKASAQPLLIGSIPNQPPEPVAWTHTFGERKARVFYTSFGHPEDFADPVFRRLLLNGILWAIGQPIPPATAVVAPAEPKKYAQDWQPLAVPGTWEDLAHLEYDGLAWYECFVKIPAAWATQAVTLAVESVDNAHEAYFNGVKIGGAGRFPPQYQNGLEVANRYVVPAENVRAEEWNVVALRVYDAEGRGGFKGAAPQLGTARQHISLAGTWRFRTGDDPNWAARRPDPNPATATFSKLEEGAVPRGSGGHAMAPRGNPLPPAEAAHSFTVPADLEFDQVLAEPMVRQPVFLNFDERGRLWVVQYIQYPAPAGLNVVSKDVFWRAVYDKVPEPPPRGVRGLDKITIHEDSDGDGRFDRHKTFVDGLNIATAVAQGRGGVWVLNPPYLLFYPDANHDDVPDGPPAVHLEGFGLEDTHSVVNSLRWGPDGWLYAAQGSTVTAQVRRPGETNQVYSQGQNIWRYHPSTHRYEIFAEGGGNAFGVELDAQGRVFSGHNGGDTRGFHYMQGAYLRKGFEKHGELSNPYAFGYFPHLPGTLGERFTHNFIIYAGGALPAQYRGNLFGVEPLQGRIVRSEVTRDGSTFRTRDLERIVTSNDTWFRPVDIKTGPDGAIYVCDWYDRQVTHTRNQEGNIDASNGRIYRLKQKGPSTAAPVNLSTRSGVQLLDMLSHENIWVRQTALRLLGDRREPGLNATIQTKLSGAKGQYALELLWALNANDGFNQTSGLALLVHPEPQVRLWTVRLLGDQERLSPDLARSLAQLAATEPNVEVRAQLASTAKRLPAQAGLAIVANLVRHAEDAEDPRLPLLCWWAIEATCASAPESVVNLFEDSPFWTQPVVEKHLLDRLMRRFAATGARKDLLVCARLLELSPSRQHSARLMKGFEEAFKGRSLAGLPDHLVTAIARHAVGSPAFLLRQGAPGALTRALEVIVDAKADKSQRLQFIQVLGEVRPPAALPPLLDLVERKDEAEVRRSALNALLGYDDARIGRTVARLYPELTGEVRVGAQTVIASRAAWSLDLAQAVERGEVQPADVPLDLVRRMQLHKSPGLTQLLVKHWPRQNHPSTQTMQKQISHLSGVVRGGKGDPYRGQKLFNGTCASCHKLFAHGGQVGPDLTPYQRGDIETLLLHIVNPSAEIREGYENTVIETRDERTLSGFLVERDNQVVVLRSLDGQTIALERKEIAEMKTAGLSLMPEGLMDTLDEQQVRDLFAYLRSTQPLAN